MADPDSPQPVASALGNHGALGSRSALGSRGALKGRGTPQNPTNRFERLAYEVDEGTDDALGREPGERPPSPRTLYLRDPSRSLISRNDSPDVPFDASINPYRGCEHGCIYCYARPTHEYLGFSAGLDFETRILVKEDAPDILRRELAARRWKPQVLALSGVTDPYQPIERKLRLTRRCLEVLLECRNPVGLITKNALVTRDLDLFEQLAEHDAVSVGVSITTLDPALHRIMEPRASSPRERLRAVERLARSKVPVHVNVAPVIPGLTDHEIPRILEAAADAGARRAGYIVMRLPRGVESLFTEWLEQHHATRSSKVLGRLRSLRGGQLSDSRFGSRMRGEGQFAEQIRQLFALSARRLGLDAGEAMLSTRAFRRPTGPQLELFG